MEQPASDRVRELRRPVAEEEEDAGDDYDEDDDEKICRGFRRPCGNKAKVEGKWCRICYGRRLKHQHKQARETLKTAAERRRREQLEQQTALRFTSRLVQIERSREEATNNFRQQQANLRAQAVGRVMMIEELPAAPPAAASQANQPPPAPAPNHVPAAAAAPAAAQPHSAGEAPPGVPPAVYQAALVLRRLFPQGGATVGHLRAIPDCPPNWSDQDLAQLIAFAGVGEPARQPGT